MKHVFCDFCGEPMDGNGSLTIGRPVKIGGPSHHDICIPCCDVLREFMERKDLRISKVKAK